MLNVAIIGAGGTGSAAARFLAREGHAVTVYEQFTLDHDKGSSYGGSRIIRRTYPDALLTRMMASAYDLWGDLEAEAGEKLFVRCGGLTFGREDNPAMTQTERSLQANGVDYERLTADETAARYPPFRLDRDQYAIFQADGGLLRASQCVKAQARLAMQAGATLRENTPVRRFRPAGGGRIVLGTDADESLFDRLLITAGPWMADLLPSLKPHLTVTRQCYAHLQAAEPAERFGIGHFPVWIDVDTNFYGFPQQPDELGVKFARHEQGRRVEPDHAAREPSPDDVRPLLDYAGRRLPALHGPPLYKKVCLYTNTPDQDFLIDAVPDVPGAFFCSGCSGHGFKFTILFGRILADLASGKAIPRDMTRFAAARLAGCSSALFVDWL